MRDFVHQQNYRLLAPTQGPVEGPLVFFRQEADVREVELCQRRTEGCPLISSSLPFLLRLFMNLEVRVQGSSLLPLLRGGALNLEFRVQGPWFGIQSLGLRVQGFVCRFKASRLMIQGLGINPRKPFFKHCSSNLVI